MIEEGTSFQKPNLQCFQIRLFGVHCFPERTTNHVFSAENHLRKHIKTRFHSLVHTSFSTWRTQERICCETNEYKFCIPWEIRHPTPSEIVVSVVITQLESRLKNDRTPEHKTTEYCKLYKDLVKTFAASSTSKPSNNKAWKKCKTLETSTFENHARDSSIKLS